ncbi:MAG: hypothetical protein N2505_04720 [Endomicrobia bacterium]|nr:hypothetical protein [Endomicrobiia bacterium]
MKKKFFSVLLVSIVLLSYSCSSIMNMKSPTATGGDKVDVNALLTREGRIIFLVGQATIQFLEAYANIFEAVGKKEEAEKLKATVKQLKDNPKDVNKTKEAVAEVNNATKQLQQIDFAKDMNEELARKYLRGSLLNIGKGLVLDGLAVPDASALVNDARSAILKVKSNPAAYGPDALAKLTRVVDVATFVSTEVPTQAKAITEVSKKLYEYAKLKGIPTPTQEEIDKESKDLQKG